MKISVKNVCIYYDRFKAIDDVSFELDEGEILSLVGPNGSGKSTLIKGIAGILKPKQGKIYIDGMDLSRMDPKDVAKCIGYVPQNFQQTFFSTVVDTVLLGRKPHIRWKVTKNDLEAVQNAIDTMGINELASKMISQISGGERQKVYIARALAQDPRAFIFDEPTSNLDIKHQLEVLEIAKMLSGKRKSSMLMALHDLTLAYNYSDRVIMLKKGRTFAMGTPEEVLTPENIREVYDVNVDILESRHGKYIMPIKKSMRLACV
ncbi:ABC-type cobalamin/Fe3+-siderophores transport system, ATPase component [Methanocella conradii HZ254]|uniref:Cobalamin import ATP-binding protein BtuD n=1 Tax=Methanocella conradii (strain DSM 24694 / JCM 17849 / CGMCC 1.5162 / HZ254) TaxID=1041930 RepID=H8I8Y3_METCZ|nr:ABC transporter ATP-binding protein [Methanocella conradii]AFD00454.1 ABC-type cobalamin/Fe3+-siderophores transport system, ATPase component [Methanocella conradii HZ254]MDI6895729.1 ABC transporter ATP-binding protein [Methanocella conradii]